MKILIAGDTHANLGHIVDTLFHTADREGIDRVFVVGDFGYWPRSGYGQDFLSQLEKTAKAYGITLYWLDGNHEDHLTLRNLTPNKDEEGFWKISEHVRYAPRGHRWTWGGKSFLALGGAFSIDRSYRRVGETFFFEEEIDQDDIERASAGGYADIMLTHDVPADGQSVAKETLIEFGYRVIPEAWRNAMRVREVVDAVNPKLLIHGHFHFNYSQTLDNGITNVIGLSCDGSGKLSYHILDLDEPL